MSKLDCGTVHKLCVLAKAWVPCWSRLLSIAYLTTLSLEKKLLFLKNPGKSLEFCIPKSVPARIIDKIHIFCVVLLFHKERDPQVHLSCWFCVISRWGIKQLRNSTLFCSQSIDSERKQNNTQNINKV